MVGVRGKGLGVSWWGISGGRGQGSRWWGHRVIGSCMQIYPV